MPRALPRIAGGIFVLALASIVASACASYDPNEDVGTTSLGLDAKCTADVNGVGTVDVETDYLPHVVHCENGGAPLESLKAQAVAARTYLYYKLQTSGSIDDGHGDQVYTCASEPDDVDREAVAETSGIVLQYESTTIAAFFVAGGAASPPKCIGSSSASTEKYVTYNAGLSGDAIEQSSIGYVSPKNYANRGCMSQLGSRCLANEGNSFDVILQFYYGSDIVFTQATGTCITSSLADGGTIFEPDGGIPPARDDDASTSDRSDDGSTLTEGGCSAAPGRADSRFAVACLGLVGALAFRRKKRN